MSASQAGGKRLGIPRAGDVPQEFELCQLAWVGAITSPPPAQTTSLVILMGVLKGDLWGMVGKGWAMLGFG